MRGLYMEFFRPLNRVLTFLAIALLAASCGPSEEELKDTRAKLDAAHEAELSRLNTELTVAKAESQSSKDAARTHIEDFLKLTAEKKELEAAMADVCRIANPPAPETFTSFAPAIPSSARAFLTNEIAAKAVETVIVYGDSLQRVTMAARDAAFEAVGEPGIMDASWFAWRDRAMDLARNYLKSPDRLWATYAALKPVALKALEANASKEQVESMRSEIGSVQSLFAVSVPDAVREASRGESIAIARVDAWSGHRCSHALREFEHWPTEHALEKAAEGTVFDACDMQPNGSCGQRTSDAIEVLQWRLRRESEGGQKLVDTWARIFADFAEALAKVKPVTPAPDAGTAPGAASTAVTG